MDKVLVIEQFVAIEFSGERFVGTSILGMLNHSYANVICNPNI
ncbi:hypothetical protein FHS10_001907 [Mucilaginibacter dorajii]|nr:hypothetical protein [Mucilaginibacter dorajii]